MRTIKTLHLLLICVLCLCACDYIVTPEPEGTPTSEAAMGWSGIVTNVAKNDAGDLHIDIAIRNDTADFSAMQAVADKPAILSSGGKKTECETVFVGTGGHRLPPGFQARGYIAGKKAKQVTQPMYVECKGAEAASGDTLIIDYLYETGEFYYYVPPVKKEAEMELNLDSVAADLKYPVAQETPNLIQKADVQITAINKCLLTLADVKRTEKGLEFKWQTSNPGEYPTYVHIGMPPVIGNDGIIYGFYESPHLASAPITAGGKTAEWTTKVNTPADVGGYYILLSVESKQQRLFANYVIDITDK